LAVDASAVYAKQLKLCQVARQTACTSIDK